MNSAIKGINVCNPVEVDKEYLMYTVEYAYRKGFNHIQINGPIHNPVIGNIDGMTPYRKYNAFESQKDASYIEKSMDAINSACKKAKEYGIKMFVWHHELEVPTGFFDVYPETCNDYGDVEITHPIVRDFLENKIEDFFYYYPDVDGIVLTLHETKVPLLKLKNQKLGKVERVKYVTEILYKTCEKLGKELIVRPFASIEEDYELMTKAYEEISVNLPIMDKWTQFDWSLTLPHNAFFNKIKKNPLLVETDIFGEYFGKGRLPIMLKKHLKEKFSYCKDFSPIGYVNRIDRAGKHPFGDVNEVNAVITAAYLSGKDPDEAIFNFFKEKYPDCAKEVCELMEKTEEVQTETFYIKGYYFTELSIFPSLNHSKNHFYFEQMRKDCNIESNEWFIPPAWQKKDIESMIREKEIAMEKAEILLSDCEKLKEKMDKEEYGKIWIKFKNLELVTKAWHALLLCFINYVRYFETNDSKYEVLLKESTEKLLFVRKTGIDALGNDFYCIMGDLKGGAGSGARDYITEFVSEIKESFEIEKRKIQEILSDKSVTDFIICGGAMEGHGIMKEVNFSDTIIKNGEMFRIPGSKRGLDWSVINAHGWFSYKLKVTPGKENIIKVTAESAKENLMMKVTIGENEYIINEKTDSKKDFTFSYNAQKEEFVRIRFDKISANVPCIYKIEVR